MLMTAERGTFTTAAPIEDPDLRWYIVRTVSGAEWQVRMGLLKRGIEPFMPYYIASIRRNEWFHGVIKALFPGYIFVGLEPGQTASDVQAVNGAQGILKVGDRLIEILPEQMERLRLQAADELITSWGAKAKVIRVNVGDWVPLPEGKLPGYDGTPVQVEAIDKRGQITASIGPGTIHFALSDLTEGPRRPLKAIRQG
jgi:transcription antitermination factor NusG